MYHIVGGFHRKPGDLWGRPGGILDDREAKTVIEAKWLILILYNGVVFGAYGWDKLRAMRGWRRTPEAVLLWMAACLGGPGALLGISLWRHKTRKPRFAVGVPLLTLAQAAALYWLLFR